jgi:hypothetical protein
MVDKPTFSMLGRQLAELSLSRMPYTIVIVYDFEIPMPGVVVVLVIFKNELKQIF